jgi:hypothetical protein
MKNVAAIGTCKVCGQGRLIVARDETSKSLYVLCEECESEWDNPEQSQRIEEASRDNHGPSTFLERDELEGHPWKVFLW